MFQKGDRIHLHDGTTRVMKRSGVPKLPKKGNREVSRIRGFVRGAIVDCLTGEQQTGDWHENYITTYGHGMVIANFARLAASTQGGATRLGIGNMTAASTDWTSMTAMQSEYGMEANSSVNQAGASRATMTQSLSGTWTLSQSMAYASSHISADVALNCVAQYANSSVGAGTALSFATFASSTKGTNQQLAITYSWLFST